ncbi:MAG: toll/interleukin-1 receptor domain-containing protein [Chloroflexi bacterium]|nr:toll/interleukin-1 receptor domain-containing protein [Chloroflexota bacterium]
MKHIFISYAHQDQEYVNRLAHDIRQHGLEPWVDNRIEHGDRWWRTIVKAIKDSIAVVVVMTPAAENSEWVEREILLAQREKKPVLPILYRGQEFAILITSQYYDVRHGGMPDPGFYARLERVARGDMPVGMTDQFEIPKPPKDLEAPPPSAQAPSPAPAPQAHTPYTTPQAQPPGFHLPTPAIKSSGNRTLWYILGGGAIAALLFIGLVIVVLALLDSSNGNSSNGGDGGDAVENTEAFLIAIGQGDLQAADRYTCTQMRGSLPVLIYNSIESLYGISLGINGSITNPQCEASGSDVYCVYDLNQSGGLSQSWQDTFIMDDDLVCDIVAQ